MIPDNFYLISDLTHSSGSSRVEEIIDTSFQDFYTLFSRLNKFMHEVEVHVFNLDIKLWTLFMWGMLGGVLVFFIRHLFDK